ncbi:uncharacterized protein LOC120104097 [Phoenix dactylifera]|uniref:Uncharacterized protein LOC120104097 n=1 Tax=Phoenix dactylifera TaxID=42345 RepID=A0A8B8ZB81_PHODC|nr:uncharacterized protein LOC120104097 [Phoenix dactylifera]
MDQDKQANAHASGCQSIIPEGYLGMELLIQTSAQIESLLLGYNLYGYVDGNLKCPSASTATSSTPDSTVSAIYIHWFCQDKLILSVILASVSDVVIPLIATSKTSQDAWSKLTKLYTSHSYTRVMQLKEELTLIQHGSRNVTEILQTIKALIDELALIDAPLSDDDITLYVLNGLGTEYQNIAAPIRARESSPSFEELHNLLVGIESYLKRLEASSQALVVTANST